MHFSFSYLLFYIYYSILYMKIQNKSWTISLPSALR
nr:MAG TPA: hypothetical protein [Caudoviricetes sp.]